MVATPRGKSTGTRIHSFSSGPAGARAVPACVSPLVDLLLKSRSVETLTVFRRYSVAAGDLFKVYAVGLPGAEYAPTLLSALD